MTQELAVFPIVAGLVGGLAFFLYGLDLMTDGLKAVAGGSLRSVLAGMTKTRFKGVLAGAFITSVIQSSSVTTVLVVGFISAGLMTLQQSIGVIFGANIGTTVTAQIVAFKITQYALIMVAAGFGMHFLSRNQRTRRWGHVLMGLGMVFFGMQLMSDGARPLRSFEPFIDAMRQMQNPALGILAGAIFTGIVQSSSATMGIVIVLASQGFITLEAGIALAFGANIGTCVTAFLAGIGKPSDAKRAAALHVVFNVVGVLIWVGFIEQLADLCRWLSPSSADLEGTARLAAETPRQVANAHTVFNVANTLILIWFAGPLASLVRRLIPHREPILAPAARPRYLDEILLATPSLALDRVRLELRRLGDMALQMLDAMPRAVFHGSELDLDALKRMDDDLDGLHGAIVTHLGRLSQQSISDTETRQLHCLLAVANNIENIGDMIETSLVEAGLERNKANLTISTDTEEMIGAVFLRVRELVSEALSAIETSDQEKALAVMDAKEELNDLGNRVEAHLAERLVAKEPNRLQAFRIETDIIEKLKRVYYFAKRIAKIVVEEAGEEAIPGEQEEANSEEEPNAFG